MKKTLLAIALCLTCTLITEGAKNSRRSRLLRFGNSPDSTLVRRNSLYPRAGTVVEKGWTWVTTYTTNEAQQVTITTVGTKTNGTMKALCSMWNDSFVPYHMREKILTLPDDEKWLAISDSMPLWTDGTTSTGGETPKWKDKSPTDDNLTKEITEIKLRW